MKYALEVDRLHLIPFQFGRLEECLSRINAGVVHEDVDGAERGERVRHRCIDTCPIAQVQTNSFDFHPRSLKLSSSCFVRWLIAIYENQTRAMLGEKTGDGVPDTGG